jgi:hypothetical protein
MCKIYGPAFSSNDKERHGNTIKLNNHMREEHGIDEEKHHLGIKPKRRRGDSSTIENFLTIIEPIPSIEEALL